MGLGRAGIVGGTSKLMIYKYSSPPGFAGAERCLRVLQGTLSIFYGRVRTAEHASRDPRRILEHRHGLSERVVAVGLKKPSHQVISSGDKSSWNPRHGLRVYMAHCASWL